MKLNNKDLVLEKLQHASPVKSGKRFAAFLIDFLIVTVLSFVFFLGGNQIAINSNQYKESYQIAQNEIEYYNDYIAPSRSMEFTEINGELVRKDEVIIENPLTGDASGINQIIFENANRAIYRSILKFGTNQVTGFNVEENIKYLKYYGEANLENDNIFFFYTQYVPAHNLGNAIINYEGVDPVVFANNIYVNTFGSDSNFFVYDENYMDVPTLTTTAAFYLYYYIYGETGNEIFDVAQDYMIIFDTAYTTMLETAEMVMRTSEPYYSTHYLKYYDESSNMAKIVNTALILSILFGYLVGVLLFKIIFGHGRSIGRVVFGLGEISVYNEQIDWKNLIIKSLIGFVGFILCSYFLYLFPPFNGSYTAMYFPFLSLFGANVPFVVLLLIISFLGIVNGTVSLFNGNKATVIDLISKSVLVDTKYVDEIINEG